MTFQSSLELSPECNKTVPGFAGLVGGFNPHSSFRPSATRRARASSYVFTRSFNPHSSFRPSATRGNRLDVDELCGFNPHSSFRPSATGLIGF